MPDLYAYTDGACSGNPGPGGWGVLLRWGELVVGSLSFGLGTYLGWQGTSGLMLS